jgi:hypothetical protein
MSCIDGYTLGTFVKVVSKFGSSRCRSFWVATEVTNRRTHTTFFVVPLPVQICRLLLFPFVIPVPLLFPFLFPIPLLVRVRSNVVRGSTASSAVVCARMYVCMYVKARSYAISTLWQSLKAIGTEMSEFFSGSTASSRDTDVTYRRLHARNLPEGCVKIWEQWVQKFRSCDRSYNQTYPFIYYI